MRPGLEVAAVVIRVVVLGGERVSVDQGVHTEGAVRDDVTARVNSS